MAQTLRKSQCIEFPSFRGGVGLGSRRLSASRPPIYLSSFPPPLYILIVAASPLMGEDQGGGDINAVGVFINGI